MKSNSFQDLIVWQKAKQLAIEIYKLTEDFPTSEQYGFTSQMRRAAVSISSNIAESYHRFHRKEKNQLLSIAFGSGSELESQIALSKEIFPQNNYGGVDQLVQEVMKLLNSFLIKE